MIVISPRLVAAEVLLSVIQQQEYNNNALKRALRQNGAMSRQDRAFVTELVNGTLRNQICLDYCLEQFSHTPVKKMKPLVQVVLRMSLYQMMFLSVPDHAAINEAVSLVKKKGLGSLAGFVNGVLRSAAKGWRDVAFPDKEKSPAEYLEKKYSHPLWVVKMWLAQYPFAFVEALCAADNEKPKVSIVANTTKISPQALKDQLEAEGVQVEEGHFLPQVLSLKGSADVTKLPSFQAGLFHVQDESSALAASSVGGKEGWHVLDACAAPGGKSFFLAEQMGKNGVVESRDIFPHKVELLKEGAARLHLTTVQARQQDASVALEEDKEQFDAVLVDAPCSGLGLLRKKADIRYRRKGEDLDSLIPLQRQILTAAAKAVRPGGVLVYSTCTICKKENEGNRTWFLENHPDFVAEDLTPYLPQKIESDSLQDGYVTLFPHIHETDGFFIARFRRKEAEK